MNLICSFDSKIHGLCLLPEDRIQRKRMRILFFAALAVLVCILLFFMPWYVPLAAAVAAIVLYSFITRFVYIRQQYQPVRMDVFASEDGGFVLSIPQMDIAGYSRRRLSTARIQDVSAFEYSPSLHCIRIEADFLNSLYTCPGAEKLDSVRERSSWYLYMPPQEEQEILSALEKMMHRRAFNMDS